MASSIALDSRQLALELHALLRDIDPARWRDDLEQTARERLREIERQLTALVERTWPEGSLNTLQVHLGELLDLMRRYAPSGELPNPQAWMHFRVHTQPAYESLAACLRDHGTHVPSLRPTNYVRNGFHVLNALWVLCLVQLVLVPLGWVLPVAIFGAVWAWSMEVGRRVSPGFNRVLMRAFGPVAHPHEEHRVNSATWYASALVALAVGFEVKAGVAGLAVLGLGDPVAAIIGRRFGQVPLINGRTLEGSLAFLAAGGFAAAVALQLWYPAPIGTTLAIAGGAALTGAVAELLARRIDDNLAIPVVAAAGATLVGWWIGA